MEVIDRIRIYLVVFLCLDINVSCLMSPEEVNNHLEQGKRLLASGQLVDALNHYGKAIEGDPSNYLSYFKRAAVYLAMGKAKSALPDLDKALQIRENFHSARVQRANANLKLGNLEEAEEDYKRLRDSPNDSEQAAEQLDVIQKVLQSVEEGRQLMDLKDYGAAIGPLTYAIENCPWDSSLRLMRAECYERTGDLQSAVLDVRPTTKLINDNTAGYLKLSLLNYHLGNAEDSLKDIRECLKLDQDHKECHTHYKLVKKLHKLLNSGENLMREDSYEDACEKYISALQVESSVRSFVRHIKSKLCHCSSKSSNVEDTFKWCGEVLEGDENDVDALCDRAEMYIQQDLFEEAIRDYQKANEKKNDYASSCNVEEKLQRAQKLLKQSQKRDYYKILGVPRTATKKQIVKAYRKLARQWHPDKFSEAEKEMAEKKFIDIAAAKEVLTDPEKRQMFDNGEDPLDHEEQHHGRNPFGHGFNPFGQGQGFSFKFHF